MTTCNAKDAAAKIKRGARQSEPFLKQLIKNEGKGVTQVKTGSLILPNKLTVKVNILNERKDFGKIRYHITPVAGTGEIWTEKVVVDEPDDDTQLLRRATDTVPKTNENAI